MIDPKLIHPDNWEAHYLKRGDPTKSTYYIIRRDRGVGLFSNFVSSAGHIRYALVNGWLPVIDMQNFPNPYLPPEKPRYLMGLGTPQEILDCIAHGVDMFDCVWPTRVARNGQVMTRKGKLNIKNLAYRNDTKPLEDGCDCFTCKHYSRAYLSHLFRSGELTSHRLLSIHNIRFLTRLMEDVRTSIEQGTFAKFKEEIDRAYK